MSAKSHVPGRVTAAAGLAVAAVLASTAPAGAHGNDDRHGRYAEVQLLSFNDLHGNLEPPQGSSGTVMETDATGALVRTPAGGVEYLATGLREARKGKKHSITVSGGDNVGASPLLSGLFHDEPTIEALDKLGTDVSVVGNHEFDEGRAELLRMENGGCHPVEGCYSDKPFKGTGFPTLAANVVDERTGRPVLRPYTVWQEGGIRIGFIGVVSTETPGIVTADGVKGLKFLDEATTIDKYAGELRRQGVNAVVVLDHEGGYAPSGAAYDYDCDATGNGLTGPITDIAAKTTPAVDLFVTGHTHNAYNCIVEDPAGDPRRIVSAASFGRLFTESTLTYDRRTRDIVRDDERGVTSVQHIVRRTAAPAADMTALIAKWNTLAAPIADKAVGHISADIAGRGSASPESPLGDLIADAQLAHAESLDSDSVLALMNPGGVRSDLVFQASGGEGDGVVTYGETFAVQPFSNTVNLVTLTGAQLVTALRQQVSGANEASPKLLQPSEGLTYTLDMRKSGADRVVTGTIELNGAAVDPAATYRVALNQFLAGGGDGFTALGEGAGELVGSDDLLAFSAYLTANSSAEAPLAPLPANRVTIIQ